MLPAHGGIVADIMSAVKNTQSGMTSGMTGAGNSFFMPAGGATGAMPSFSPANNQGVYDPGKYGDAQNISISVPVNAPIKALDRPQFRRVYLMIQNPSAQPLYFAFGQQPNANSSWIWPNSGILFDNAVPQNDLYLSSPGAPFNVPIMFMNVDAANAK